MDVSNSARPPVTGEQRSYFLHPQGLVDQGAIVGARSRVWAFAHVAAGAIVGEDCNLCDHTFVESGVIVGNRVTLKSGVFLWSGTRLEDDVFVGPNATFTNDRRPRSKHYPPSFAGVTVRQGASIGAMAVLLPGIEIGRFAMVGAGAVVTRSVPNQALVLGNPARLAGWVCRCGSRIEKPSAIDSTNGWTCSECGGNSLKSQPLNAA